MQIATAYDMTEIEQKLMIVCMYVHNCMMVFVFDHVIIHVIKQVPVKHSHQLGILTLIMTMSSYENSGM